MARELADSSPDQRPTMLDGLPEAREFVEECVALIGQGNKISFADIWRVAKDQLGYPGSKSSLSDYVRKRWGKLEEIRARSQKAGGRPSGKA